MEITRHFTVSTYIVYQHKVLLHLHKKLELWLPVGGHIERDELPEDAAIREVLKESGLRVSFRPGRVFDDGRVRELVMPVRLMVQTIQPGHQHIDFAFYTQSETDELHPEGGEIERYRWLSERELDGLPLRENVKLCALEALKMEGAA